MRVWMLLVGAVVVSRPAGAQQSVELGSELDQYVRLLEIEGKVTGTPLVYHPAWLAPREKGFRADTTHLWATRHPLQPRPDSGRIRFIPLEAHVRAFYNSAFPRTANDGALWAGRGVSTSIAAGAQISWGPLSGRLYPTLVYEQNRDFQVAPVPFKDRSPYAYPWQKGIDFPQRFGNGSLDHVDWGQSGVRLDLGPFTTGLSTENLWWGPGFRNAIIMSNTA